MVAKQTEEIHAPPPQHHTRLHGDGVRSPATQTRQPNRTETDMASSSTIISCGQSLRFGVPVSCFSD